MCDRKLVALCFGMKRHQLLEHSLHYSGGFCVEIKNRMWMTGSLDWFAFIGDQEVWLGRREVPYPLDEGDSWINQAGDSFKVVDGEIVLLGRVDPPKLTW